MRLIDADALIDVVDGYLTDSVEEGKCIEKIMDAPTIDAVPVIRCKDCKWQGDDEHCPVCNSCGRGSLPSGDWYCADGERKES